MRRQQPRTGPAALSRHAPSCLYFTMKTCALAEVRLHMKKMKQMNARRWTSGLLLLASALSTGKAISAPHGCVPVPIYKGHPQEARAYIKAPGSYCLQRDVLAVKRFDVHSGSFKAFGSEELISISQPFGEKPITANSANTYQLELGGHRLVAEAGEMPGIENRSGGVGITVRNGFIEVPGSTKSNRGITLRADSTALNPENGQCPIGIVKCEDIPSSQTIGDSTHTLK